MLLRMLLSSRSFKAREGRQQNKYNKIKIKVLIKSVSQLQLLFSSEMLSQSRTGPISPGENVSLNPTELER